MCVLQELISFPMFNAMAVKQQLILAGETITATDDLIADNSTTPLGPNSLAPTKWKNIPFETCVTSPRKNDSAPMLQLRTAQTADGKRPN